MWRNDQSFWLEFLVKKWSSTADSTLGVTLLYFKTRSLNKWNLEAIECQNNTFLCHKNVQMLRNFRFRKNNGREKGSKILLSLKMYFYKTRHDSVSSRKMSKL